LDTDIPTYLCYQYLPELVRNGRVPEALVDRAARRVLRLKFALGLFDQPYVNPDRAEKLAGAPEHRATARQVAGRGIVLLKNDQNLLPLDPAKIKTLALIGPNADVAINGNYAAEPNEKISPLAGLRARLGDRVKILHHPGVVLTRSLPKSEADLFLLNNPSEKDAVHLEDPAANLARITEAVAVARQADVVVLCLGTNKDMMREGWAIYHKGDNAELSLRAQQLELIDAVLATGKPVVVLLFTAGPVIVEQFADRVPALAQCWYLGQETGPALADFLFGDIDASGRLPISIPRSEGQLPVFYNHKPTGKLRGYLFEDTQPRYAFGQGLSYTTFAYANLRLDLAPAIPATADKPATPAASVPPASAFSEIRVLLDVTNTGTRPGVAVPQLYVRDEVSSVTRPVKELKDFARIELAPGETRTVPFTLTWKKLSFLNADNQRVVESGDFTVMAGASSLDADLTQRLTLTLR
jgi:beta-glucosidase